jgi:2-dehydro-3-deoxygluconokinase
VRRFPLTKWVAMTLREGQSASHSRWGAFLYQAADGKSWFAPTTAGIYAPFDITAIVDPLGAGDAFMGALVFALQTPELAEPARALHFATAASCLAHSISGDFNFCSRQEVEGLMAGSNGSRVGR